MVTKDCPTIKSPNVWVYSGLPFEPFKHTFIKPATLQTLLKGIAHNA